MGSVPVYVGCAPGRAIDLFDLDLESGALERRGTYPTDSDVQWLASGPAAGPDVGGPGSHGADAGGPGGGILYAALRSNPPSVLTLRAPADGGTLSEVDRGPLAASMAYLSADATGNHLFAASYTDHLITVSSPSGHPITAQRSPGRHAHCVLLSPDAEYLYATTLGDDRIVWWRFNEATGELGEGGTVDAEPGSGPRHLAFSNTGERLYVLHEMAGTVVVYSRQEDSGALTELQSISAVSDELNLVPGRVRDGSGPAPEPNAIWSAELRLTPNNRFLYCSERSSSTISRFAVDPDGRLTYVDRLPTEAQPRGMNIDPTGAFLLVCGEVSHQLTVYRIDPEDGSLARVARRGCAAGPRCIEFVGG